jgi:hypothetical protein
MYDELIRGRVRVEWVELGEGWNGYYQEDDPDDEELLRFDVSWWLPDTDDPENIDPSNENAFGDWSDPNDEPRTFDPLTGSWSDPGDASYCTRFPAKATDEQRRQGLQILMNAVYDPLTSGYPIKKLCEELSWIGLDWLE